MPILINLLSNIRIWIAIGGFVAGGWAAHQWDAWALKSALSEQETTLVKQCDAQKKITEEANNALQKDRDTIAAKLASSKLLQPAKCVSVASVANHTSSGGEHAGQNGVRSDWLYEYAAECETYRSEVILLNNFGLGERK